MLKRALHASGRSQSGFEIEMKHDATSRPSGLDFRSTDILTLNSWQYPEGTSPTAMSWAQEHLRGTASGATPSRVSRSSSPEWLNLDYRNYHDPLHLGQRTSGETCGFLANLSSGYPLYSNSDEEKASAATEGWDQTENSEPESTPETTEDRTVSQANGTAQRKEHKSSILLFIAPLFAMCIIGLGSYYLSSTYIERSSNIVRSRSPHEATTQAFDVGIKSTRSMVPPLKGRHFHAPESFMADIQYSTADDGNYDELFNMNTSEASIGESGETDISEDDIANDGVHATVRYRKHHIRSTSPEFMMRIVNYRRRTMRVTRKAMSRRQGTLRSRKSKFCATPVCEEESDYLDRYLNWNIKACNSFYGFVCTRWKEMHPVTGTSTDALLVQRTENGLYNDITARGRLDPRHQQLRQLFVACGQKMSSEDYRLDLSNYMYNLGLRGWPFARGTKNTRDVWKSEGLLLRKLGLATIASVVVDANPNSDDRHIIAIGEPSLLIGHYDTKYKGLPEWYSKAVKATLSLFIRGQFSDTLKGILDFTGKLAEIAVNRGYECFAARRYKVVPLKQFSHLTQLLTLVFRNISTISDNTRVLIKSETYLKSLRPVMHASTPADVLNYIGFRAITHISPLLRDLENIVSVQMRELTGITQTKWPRWRRCLRMLERVLPIDYLRVFNRNKQRLDTETVMRPLLTEIKLTFANHIGDATWIGSADKVTLKNKLSRVKMEDIRSLLSKFPNRGSRGSSWPAKDHGRIIPIYEYLAKQLFRKRLLKVQLPRDIEAKTWKGSIFNTHPTVDTQSNRVFMPIAMFDPRYLASKESLLFQIPRIATKVVVALLQAIHQSNYPRDKLTWSADTLTGFRDAQKCVQKHYEQRFDGRIRRDITSELNTLDSMSLLVAFNVFRKRAIQVSSFLTGKNITANQLFFVLYAKSLCETMSAELRKQTEQENVRGASYHRVNGPLRNSARFANSWGCAPGAPMNPTPKCAIWNT
ncbi:neprilysin-2-like [Ornithodoros turicata]|uniref:neprilysin-2-like n=1 Tax=Ornithodoros turicata TaxID=34597 RepID=UPI0031390C24